MSLTDKGNITGEADLVEENNELGTAQFMVPAGHLA